MTCLDEKLILVEITFLKLPGISSNFALLAEPVAGGVCCMSTSCLLVYSRLLWHSIIAAKLQPFSPCGQSHENGFEGKMAHAVRHFDVTLNWLNIVILGSIID